MEKTKKQNVLLRHDLGNEPAMPRQMGEPVNSKSLLAFIFRQMALLDAGEISTETACAQAKLASQANNLLAYELNRTIVQMKLHEMGESTKPVLREIESKHFDNTTNIYEKSY